MAEGRPKKQIPLRLSAKLYDQIAAWAEDDFRSVNGQIEYLLTECVRQRKKKGQEGTGNNGGPAGIGLLGCKKKSCRKIESFSRHFCVTLYLKIFL